DEVRAPGAAASDADHDVRQAAAPLEMGEGREDLLEREVAGDAEDHQRVARRRGRVLHGAPFLWPARGLPPCKPRGRRAISASARQLYQLGPGATGCLPTFHPNTRPPPTRSAR